MAGSSLFALLDDIATLLDDISVMTKVAAKKTAGVLGDDLALNAQQVTGVKADRELPVVWAVAKGSFLNKAILVPAALLISFLAPWLITPLLMLGGAYLCFEGFEKVFHRWLPHDDYAETPEEHAKKLEALADEKIDLVALEKDKIKGAIRTDFILSAEIIVIALGSFGNQPFMTRALALTVIAILMTVGVYGLVAAIVKIDDAGLHLVRDRIDSDGNSVSGSGIGYQLGRFLLWLAPNLMKTLSFVGTLAMFLVGGGIILHGIHVLEAPLHTFEHLVETIPGVGIFLKTLSGLLYTLVVGVVTGGIVVAGVLFFKKLRGNKLAVDS